MKMIIGGDGAGGGGGEGVPNKSNGRNQSRCSFIGTSSSTIGLSSSSSLKPVMTTPECRKTVLPSSAKSLSVGAAVANEN